jgi:beta-xylosidase
LCSETGSYSQPETVSGNCKPLIDKFYNGAQPIDQFGFKDKDGQYYFIYGGWRHCNIAKLKDDFTGLVPYADGTTSNEITPKGYVDSVYVYTKGQILFYVE